MKTGSGTRNQQGSQTVKEELNCGFLFNREVEEDHQLNEMMKNLGEHPSERIPPTSSQTLYQQAPFLC